MSGPAGYSPIPCHCHSPFIFLLQGPKSSLPPAHPFPALPPLSALDSLSVPFFLGWARKRIISGRSFNCDDLLPGIPLFSSLRCSTYSP